MEASELAQWASSVAQTIRAERAAAHMSQAELARRAGIGRVSYIRYETGERQPSFVQIAAICDALELSLGVFTRRVADRVAVAKAAVGAAARPGVDNDLEP